MPRKRKGPKPTPNEPGDSVLEALRRSQRDEDRLQQEEAHRRMREEEETDDADLDAVEPRAEEVDPEDSPDEPPELEPPDLDEPEAPPAPSTEPRARRRRGNEDDMSRKRGERPQSPHANMTDVEKLDNLKNYPEVGMRLVRHDSSTGQLETVGVWETRPTSDFFNAEGWTRGWSGGGKYTLNVILPGETSVYVTKSYRLPGPELEPKDIRDEQEQAAQNTAAQLGGRGIQGPPHVPGVTPPETDVWGRVERPRYQPRRRREEMPLRPSSLSGGGGLGLGGLGESTEITKMLLERAFAQGASPHEMMYERRIEEERRERERERERERRRQEEDRRERERREEERDRVWQEKMDRLEREREEERKARESREREEERRRADEEVRRREEIAQRDREKHQDEMRRLEEKHAADRQRDQERTAQQIKEIQEQTARLEAERRREDAERDRRHQEELARLTDKSQHQETLQMIEKLVADRGSDKGESLLATVLSTQTESSRASQEAQNQWLQMFLAQLASGSNKDTEFAKIMLEAVNPERQMASFQGIADMSTRNAEFMMSFLNSEMFARLLGQEEQSPWMHVVDKITEAVSGGAEAVLAAREQQAQQSQDAAEAARRYMASRALQAQQRAAQGLPAPPPQGPPVGPPAPGMGAPGPGMSFQGMPPTPPPAAAPPAVPPPAAPPMDASFEEVEEVDAQPQANPEPILRIREALEEGRPAEFIADMIYDYVSFMDRFHMFPADTQQAIFENPDKAIPGLLLVAVDQRPEPPVELTEEDVVAIIEEFKLIVAEVRERDGMNGSPVPPDDGTPPADDAEEEEAGPEDPEAP